MPKERTKRTGAHAPSVKLAKRQFVIHGGLEQVQVGSLEDISGSEVLKSLEKADEPRNAVKKKEKLQLKREAFIDKLRSFRSSSSKNQKRRLKKKQKEQVGGGLDAIQAAISALDGERIDNIEQTEQIVDESTHLRIKSKPGQIGEGKGLPLKQNQRKRALEMERLRAPMILTNPAYASNPFQTIRTHAQNTLLKHEHPSP
ncbi:hypothetical protein PILCRDRAFT_358167 [Piloderma croceum F 1598]|uniref:Ribosome biogenesis protein SLX9 n=1 Tax=Piloderma croceum (strain F 1598) TaxID=765440 RepID=A0A0C3G005_PILCF|nr:hypothetical protein PILCRDRAFT_358167 [Piloderma croceum F 1598]